MKIKSIYISAFGGIKDRRIDFTDGFNVVYGENEMGKTTIMSFIKMMFYGSGRAANQLSKNPRRRYAPWDGSQPAGSIEFSHQGRNYRLEKEFRSSNSTDRTTLCDLDFGTRQAVGSDVGSSIFGLSAGAFERSVFIGQPGFGEKDAAAEGEINQRLSNIALTGEDSTSFEEVNGRLQKARLALMSKSGKAGEYDKNLKLLKEVREKISLLKGALAECDLKKTQVETLLKQLEEWENEAKRLREKLESEQDIRNTEKLKKLLELKEELDDLNKTLTLSNGKLIDDVYLKKLRFCLGKYNLAKNSLIAKQTEISMLNQSIEAALNPPEEAREENAKLIEDNLSRLELQKADLNEEIEGYIDMLSVMEGEETARAERAKKSINIPLLIIGLTLIFPAVGLYAAIRSPLFIIPIIIGLAAAVLSFIIKPRDPKPLERLKGRILDIKTELSELRMEETALLSEISRLQARLEAISSVENSSAAVVEKQRQLLNNATAESQRLKEELTAEEEVLKEILGLFNSADISQIDTALEEIREKSDLQKRLKQEINFILKDLNNISYQEAAEKLSRLKDKEEDLSCDFDALKGDYDRRLNDISNCKEAIAVLNTEIKAKHKGTENIGKLEKLEAELCEKTALQKEFCSCLELASQVLTESFAEVRQSYGSVLDKKAAEIFVKLTADRYEDMNISKSLDINVTKKGVFGMKEIDYLSSGTADQAYLSLRLALSQLICGENESLPIFLDDALTQYDDPRMERAVEFLKEYSDNTQIILFTCHKQISDCSGQIGAEVIKL